MASRIRIKFISQGFYDILNSSTVAQLCNSVADGIAQRAGEGFEANHDLRWNYGGSPRAGASVWARTHDACVAEATGKALSRAVRP